jgi:hypothetical protein
MTIFSFEIYGQDCNDLKESMSKDLYKTQISFFGENVYLQKLDKSIIQSFKWYNRLNFSTKNDTILLLEYAGVQGNYFCTFWNKKDTLSFTNQTGNIELSCNTLFTDYMMKTVSEWDIKSITKEEKLHPILPEVKVYATRIVFINGIYKIDCIRFNDFFDLKRDGRDF